jgi:hypothetical protein
VGDGPDWRQVDRARLLQVRAEERKQVMREWVAWIEGLTEYACQSFLDGPSILERLDKKRDELNGFLFPEPKAPRDTTALPETETTPLAETKTTE